MVQLLRHEVAADSSCDSCRPSQFTFVVIFHRFHCRKAVDVGPVCGPRLWSLLRAASDPCITLTDGGDMTRAIAIAALLTLAGCEGPDERAEIAEVNSRNALARVAQLESRVQELERQAGERERTITAAAERPRPEPAPEPRDAYMLVGPATLSGAGTRYPSEQRCEAAREALVRQSMERAARLKGQGMITVGEPLVSCMPL